MFYIVVKFQAPGYNTFWDMNFFLVWFLVQSHTDRRKVMHMSPPCMCTGGLKKSAQRRKKILANVGIELDTPKWVLLQQTDIDSHSVKGFSKLRASSKCGGVGRVLLLWSASVMCRSWYFDRREATIFYMTHTLSFSRSDLNSAASCSNLSFSSSNSSLTLSNSCKLSIYSVLVLVSTINTRDGQVDTTVFVDMSICRCWPLSIWVILDRTDS